MGRAVLLLSLALLHVWVCNGIALEPEPRLAPDKSLSADDYIEAGMPDPTQAWGAAERERARLVLLKIQESDPTQLPRLDSKVSGAVFAKLLEEEFSRGTFEGPSGRLTRREEEGVGPEALAELVASGSLFWAYVEAARSGWYFDREAVALQAGHLSSLLLLWGQHRAQFAEFDREIRLNKAIEESSRSIEQANERVVLMLVVLLAEQSSSTFFRSVARDDAIEHLRLHLPEIALLLSLEGKMRMRDELRRVAGSPTAHPALRNLLEDWEP